MFVAFRGAEKSLIPLMYERAYIRLLQPYSSEISRGLRPLKPPLGLDAQRRTRGGVSTLHPSYSQYVTGRPQDFVLQATVASDISDTIAKDDEYYNDTTPAPI